MNFAIIIIINVFDYQNIYYNKYIIIQFVIYIILDYPYIGGVNLQFKKYYNRINNQFKT